MDDSQAGRSGAVTVGQVFFHPWLTVLFGLLSSVLFGLLSPWLTVLFGLLSPLADCSVLFGLLSPWLAALFGLLSPWLTVLFGLLSPWLTLLSPLADCFVWSSFTLG